ncbi:MAG: hypothetical protein FWC54_03910 [Actinomycetia bacterium]|nr:hypothetical protein [Actinomycetes bacterium]
MIRKVFVIGVALALVLGLGGCSVNSLIDQIGKASGRPEELAVPGDAVTDPADLQKAVDQMIAEAQAGNADAFQSGFTNGDATDISILGGGLSYTPDLLKALSKNLSIKLSDTQVSGTKATTTAKITNTDFSGVAGELIGKIMSSGTVSSDKIGAQLTGILEARVKAGKTVSTELPLKLTRQGNTWTIDRSSVLDVALLGKLL